jgi:hypothetical protein
MQSNEMPLHSEFTHTENGHSDEWITTFNHFVDQTFDGFFRVMQWPSTLAVTGLCFGFFGYCHFKRLPLPGCLFTLSLMKLIALISTAVRKLSLTSVNLCALVDAAYAIAILLTHSRAVALVGDGIYLIFPVMQYPL